jgi:hypothetical protein
MNNIDPSYLMNETLNLVEFCKLKILKMVVFYKPSEFLEPNMHCENQGKKSRVEKGAGTKNKRRPHAKSKKPAIMRSRWRLQTEHARPVDTRTSACKVQVYSCVVVVSSHHPIPRVLSRDQTGR